MYEFKCVKTGKVVEVDFETMMTHVGGFIEIEGDRYKKIESVSKVFGKREEKENNLNATPIISDSLGCPMHQIEEFQADAKINGFSGVEFKTDPNSPYFAQAHFSDEKQKRRYMEHRDPELIDKNSKNGSAAILSPASIEAAKKLVERNFSRNSVDLK